MKPLCLAALLAACLSAQTLPYRQTAFSTDDVQANWTVWAPRAEIAPRGYVDELHSRSGHGSLALSGQSNPAEFGGWQRTLRGVQAGAWYRFSAGYRGEGLDYPSRQVVARLDWLDAAGKRVGQPEYPWETTADAEWTVVGSLARADTSARR